MRENQSVLSHRACGSPQALLSLPGLDLLRISLSTQRLGSERNKVMAGGTPANPAESASLIYLRLTWWNFSMRAIARHRRINVCGLVV